MNDVTPKRVRERSLYTDNPDRPKPEHRKVMKFECPLDALAVAGLIDKDQREAGIWFRKWYERCVVGPNGAFPFDGNPGGAGYGSRSRPDTAIEAQDRIRVCMRKLGIKLSPMFVAILGEGRTIKEVCQQFASVYGSKEQALQEFIDGLDVVYQVMGDHKKPLDEQKAKM